MPYAAKPSCTDCKSTSSNIWRKNQNGEVVCNSCHLKKPGTRENSEEPSSSKTVRSTKESHGGVLSGSQYIGPIRKSARLKPSKYKYQATIKPLATKGKSRRVIFKKNPVKAPSSVATVVSSDYLFHDSQYWQTGDVVSVMDHDGGIYYAQLRGFLQDQYCQKSAVITWLLPTTQSPRDKFDPATYILGPEEDLPRPMDCFEFVCHAPSEYYRSKSSPFQTVTAKPEIGYICTPLNPPIISKVPTREEIYGLTEERQLHVTGRKDRKNYKNNVPQKDLKEPVKKEPTPVKKEPLKKEPVKKEPLKKEVFLGRRGKSEGKRNNGKE